MDNRIDEKKAKRQRADSPQRNLTNFKFTD